MLSKVSIRTRRADSTEVAALTRLALRSKAHWGYPPSFMEVCREELTLTADTIARAIVIVAENEGALLGFVALVRDADSGEAELGWFFVEPSAISTGVGRELWRAIVRE